MPAFRVPAFLFALAMTGLLTPAVAQEKRVAHITVALGNPFVGTVAKTIQDEGKKNGMAVSVFGGPFDAALQSQQIDDAIAQKYDAIALFPANPNALLPALTRAKAAGIPVVLINSGIASGHDDLYLSYVGEDQKVLGQIVGKMISDAAKGRDAYKVAIISGTLSESTPQSRIAGFKDAIAANPKIEIVAVEDARWDTARSEQIAGQLFARFAARGGLDAVFAMADYMAFGVIKSAKAARIPLGTGKGQTMVVASNCAKMGIDAIAAGEQFGTATQMPARTGRETVATLKQHFAGQPIKKENILEMVAITKQNVETFRTDCTF
ncbi:MAG: sugar ABC transporter substrate-binding protein [Rhizobiales bacterium]|nr:sugar ABC transporter substrate-binding protein [Hyphomicrobiales bacterium]